MSIQFSNTTTKGGILQLIERNCGFNDGDITGNATLLAQFTSDVNVALDQVLSIIFDVGGTWKFDDSNHTDHPIITTSLVANQRDYSFTTDESGNLILDIFKVFVADSSGNYTELCPVNVPFNSPSNYTDGLNTTGIPNSYDKRGNSIFVDPIPNYTKADGIKIYINRESTYFTTTDATKKAGFAGIFHEYLALRPSYFYCLRNGIAKATVYKQEMLEMEQRIRDYYKARDKNVTRRLVGASNCAR